MQIVASAEVPVPLHLLILDDVLGLLIVACWCDVALATYASNGVDICVFQLENLLFTFHDALSGLLQVDATLEPFDLNVVRGGVSSRRRLVNEGAANAPQVMRMGIILRKQVDAVSNAECLVVQRKLLIMCTIVELRVRATPEKHLQAASSTH